MQGPVALVTSAFLPQTLCGSEAVGGVALPRRKPAREDELFVVALREFPDSRRNLERQHQGIRKTCVNDYASVIERACMFVSGLTMLSLLQQLRKNHNRLVYASRAEPIGLFFLFLSPSET